MRIFILQFFFLSICINAVNSQAQFDNRNDLLAYKDSHSGVPVGIADMNGDGLDDIVVLDFATDIFIQYQTPDPARPYIRYVLPRVVDNNEQNDICIADFNNDGANDILMVGSYDRVKVFYSIPHTYDFNLVHIVVDPFFSQGASAGDFNHDGWVDVVLLNDNGLNYTLLNDGAGNLVEADLFDFFTVPPSDNSGNYGCVYTDFDMDGDVDFYIAKCRQGVNSPSDPRRINALFVNDGTGNYTEDAATYGLANGRQTWTADFGDFDNDGDMDCFMTQHDVISELFENINNDTFINITASAGLNIGGIPLQGMFRDFDNDGFLDILVSGDRLDYYHNNGNKTFTKTDPFNGVIYGTFALGDLNNDGFTDVYASTVNPFNNPNPLEEDILFINQPNDNHFLGLTLTETNGNPSAIGAMALLYGPWGIQSREVRGGEQYGVSSGHSLIFGLGAFTTYDSLIIRWADGTREQVGSLDVDHTWSITRGGCYKLPLEILEPLNVLCGDDTVTVHLDSALPVLVWSDGSSADSLLITREGLYYAILQDTDGCQVKTTVMEVGLDPDTIQPSIIYDGNPLLCNGEAANLSLTTGQSFEWSTGETTQTISVTSSGEYFGFVQGFCKVLPSDTITLDFVVPDAPVTTNDTFLLGEVATLTASGEDVEWYADPFGIYLMGTGNSIQLENLTDTLTIYARNTAIIEGLDFQAGPAQHQGLTKYNGSFINGGLEFSVYDPIILHQFTVYTDSAGMRNFLIYRGDDLFYEHQADLQPGGSTIDIEIALPEGEYTISTDTAANVQAFGVNSPYLWRSSAGVDFPYEVQDVMSITNSTFGEDFYYYFYDWKVSTLDKVCSSDFVPATAVLDLGTSTYETSISENAILVNPNPTNGQTFLTIKTTGRFEIDLFQEDGTRISTHHHVEGSGNIFMLDLSAYPAGLYFVSVTQHGQSFARKIIRL